MASQHTESLSTPSSKPLRTDVALNEKPQHGSVTQSTALGDINPESHIDEDVDSERKLRGLPWFLVIMAVLSPTFLYALDNTVMANVRPSIIDTFGELDMITWLSVAYPMGELGANPLWYVLGKCTPPYVS
jgi:hypothetical protein